jgi:hypothetical protein
MAKETAKPVKKTATKRTTSTAKVSTSASDQIEKVCVESLKKLQELGTLTVFQAEKSKKTKGVTAKMITDLEGALNTSA